MYSLKIVYYICETACVTDEKTIIDTLNEVLRKGLYMHIIHNVNAKPRVWVV